MVIHHRLCTQQLQLRLVDGRWQGRSCGERMLAPANQLIQAFSASLVGARPGDLGNLQARQVGEHWTSGQLGC
jgi:hypothetical protein